MRYVPIFLGLALVGSSSIAFWQTGNVASFVTSILVIFIFSQVVSQLLTSEYPNPEPPPHRNGERDALIARYELVNSEITRYRDLSWKVVALGWGIYYVVVLPKDKTALNLDLGTPIMLLILFLTAVFATIFILYCERMTDRNRELRRLLELDLGLTRPFGHTPEKESPLRIGYLFSIFAFLLGVWAPVLISFWWSRTH